MLPPSAYYSNIPSRFMAHIKEHEDEYSCAVFCARGQVVVFMDDRNVALNARQILFIQANTPIKDIHAYIDADVHMMALGADIRKELIHYCMREDKHWWEKDRTIYSSPVISLTEKQATILGHYAALFRIYAAQTEKKVNKNITRQLLNSAALEILGWIEIEASEAIDKLVHGRTDILYRRFITLLQKQNGKKREVQWFAEELAITPKYLTTICHISSGKTASDLISEATLVELKRLLIQTDMSAKDIAERLEFITPSFFCKFVKRELGMSTKDYRKMYRA